MYSRVWSSTTIGVDALPVEIETHVENGMPRYTVVGLPQGAVRESRDRILAAVKQCALPVPRGVITVNLAPADVRKEGAAFDLPLAVGLLAATVPSIDCRRLDDLWIMGELALDGSVRPVRGVLPMAMRAHGEGCAGVVVPRANAPEAAVVDGLDVYPVDTLQEALGVVNGSRERQRFESDDLEQRLRRSNGHALDWSDVRGQENVKRALEVAAAGGHNALLVGPPGAGKTMLARRLPTILPPLSTSEALETTKIHSVAGHLGAEHGLVTARPFRSPHHTISDAGLCGGGAHPRPGEISLAHHGVLFLDELPEFKRRVLEVLRQPLEAGAITISRAQQTVDYPARFMLVASMNPCPCGHLNNPDRPCVCTPAQVQRYLARVSGPLMDRIDLHVEVTPVPYEDLSRRDDGETSARVRTRVVRARNVQAERLARKQRLRKQGAHCNAQMSSPEVRTHCRPDSAGREMLRVAMQRLGLSARAYDRVLKVARTVADLEGSAGIGAAHVSEAIQYRSLDREGWGVR